MRSDPSRVQPVPRPTLFLDRDGIVNVDRHYVHRVEDITLTPTAAEGIRLANARGYWVVVVTNQSGIARGMFDMAAVNRCHRRIDEILAANGAHVDAYYVSPYHKDGIVPAFAIDHVDRKPGPGMLLRAIRDFPIDRQRSILFGDKDSDIAAARSAGVRAERLATDNCDLAAAVDAWLSGLGARASEESSLDALHEWIVAEALPCWADRGFDPVNDRFHERLDGSGKPLIVPHRSMVQARQIAVYAKAATLGWFDGSAIAERAMFALCRDFADSSDDMDSFAFSIDPRGRDTPNRTRDAYGHAFILFAIANLYELTGTPALLTLAERIVRFLECHLVDPVHGGLISAADHPQAIKLQNPQMHLLEAYLALAQVSGDNRYLDRARAAVAMFRDRLFDRASHFLPEQRGVDWSLLPDRARTFEPGHHYEWIWLLGEYERLSGTDMADLRNALSLRASRDGSAPCALVYDEVALDGRVVGGGHRIWQQTEAMRTCLMPEHDGPAFADRIAMHLRRHFLNRPFRGGWIDHLNEDLTPRIDHVPASTLYHLFTATCAVSRRDARRRY